MIVPGIFSRFNLPELCRRFKAVDLVAVDIDHCIFPGFTQIFLGYQILLRILNQPIVFKDMLFIPQLLAGGLYLQKRAVLNLTGGTATNDEMMKQYAKIMNDVPESYFILAAKSVIPQTFSGVIEALSCLGKRAAVGFISFGIDIIANEYMYQFNAGSEKPRIIFANSNKTKFIMKNGRSVFRGYEQPLWSVPHDKLQWLRHNMNLFNSVCPLVIGNGFDESEIASFARSCGGFSIAFQPTAANIKHFDLLIYASNWQPLAKMVEDIWQY
jgi:hypothetical protein